MKLVSRDHVFLLLVGLTLGCEEAAQDVPAPEPMAKDRPAASAKSAQAPETAETGATKQGKTVTAHSATKAKVAAREVPHASGSADEKAAAKKKPGGKEKSCAPGGCAPGACG